MHTKTILTILFLAIANMALAQKEPLLSYEWLEEKSKTISDLQQKTKGLKSDGADLSFGKNNFAVSYSDKLTSYSFNIKKNGSEAVAVVEDIDLIKVTGLLEYENVIHILFPENSLTIQVYENEEISTAKFNSLQFYTNSEEDRTKMFAALYELIIFLKADKGLISSSDLTQHWQEYHKMKPYDFYQKYPKSILSAKGQMIEEDNNKQIQFVNSFAKRYNVPNLGKIEVKELKLKIPETKDVFKRRRLYHEQAILKPKDLLDKKPVFVSYVLAHNWKEYRSGSIRDDFDDANIVSGIGYTISVTQNKEEAMNKYNSVSEELTKNLNNDNLVNISKGNKSLNIKFHKGVPYESISLNFIEHKIKNSSWYEVNLLFNPNGYWSKLWD